MIKTFVGKTCFIELHSKGRRVSSLLVGERDRRTHCRVESAQWSPHGSANTRQVGDEIVDKSTFRGLQSNHAKNARASTSDRHAQGNAQKLTSVKAAAKKAAKKKGSKKNQKQAMEKHEAKIKASRGTRGERCQQRRSRRLGRRR